MSTVLLTPEQVAERLHIRPRTVREYLRQGLLRGTRLVKAWRVTEEALEEFIRDGEVRRTPEPHEETAASPRGRAS